MTKYHFRFSTSQYEFVHGKKPRGYGHWAFFFDGQTDVERAFFSTYTSFGEAKKQAVAYARKHNHRDVEVGS